MSNSYFKKLLKLGVPGPEIIAVRIPYAYTVAAMVQVEIGLDVHVHWLIRF
jgi:hypothetical protein